MGRTKVRCRNVLRDRCVDVMGGGLEVDSRLVYLLDRCGIRRVGRGRGVRWLGYGREFVVRVVGFDVELGVSEPLLTWYGVRGIGEVICCVLRLRVCRECDFVEEFKGSRGRWCSRVVDGEDRETCMLDVGGGGVCVYNYAKGVYGYVRGGGVEMYDVDLISNVRLLRSVCRRRVREILRGSGVDVGLLRDIGVV